MIQIAADLAKLYTSFMERDLCKTPPFAQFQRQAQILSLEILNVFLQLKFSPSLNLNKIEHFSKVSHMDALSQTFLLLILKKVAFNQAVFSGRKIIPQTSKPGSDTNMAPGQKGIWQGAKRPHRSHTQSIYG